MEIRVASAQEMGYLANLPLVAPGFGLAKDMWIDLSKMYNKKGNVGFVAKGGGMIFAYAGDGVYECHFMFPTTIPGKVIKQAATVMIDEMFTKRGARVIKGCPPRDNRAVRVMGIALGFSKVDNSEFTDTLGRVCDVYEKRV